MTEEKPKTDWSKQEIGVLWKKKSPTQSFYSGKVTLEGKDYEIMCFTNKHKTEDKHPDLRIYLSEEKESPLI